MLLPHLIITRQLDSPILLEKFPERLPSGQYLRGKARERHSQIILTSTGVVFDLESLEDARARVNFDGTV